MFYRHPSADMLFAPEDVDTAALKTARALHYGSISMINEPSRSATLHAIEVARQAGCLISCDPNLRLPLWPDVATARDGLQQALSKAQVVKLSDQEVDFLTGSDTAAAARAQLWHQGMQLMTITRGESGCSYLTADGEGSVAGFTVDAVDATGAGDGFVAGILQGLVRDPAVLRDEARLRALCRFANAVAALATTERGAIPAMPNPGQVDRLLSAQPIAETERRRRRAKLSGNSLVGKDPSGRPVRSHGFRGHQRPCPPQADARAVPPRSRPAAAGGMPDHRGRAPRPRS
jgi:fructokinase